MTDLCIRTMTEADLDYAAARTAAEGWRTQTRETFEAFYAHAPAGCLVAERGDRPGTPARQIGICVATPYGEYGFVGGLIVEPEERGQGVGRRLLERAVAYLREQGAHSVFLDAVLAAVPLYERVGFRKVCRSLRFSGKVEGRAHPHVRRMTPADLDAVCALDREAFGADRRFFLERRLSGYPRLCQALECEGRIAGYALVRRVDELVAVGPWVAGPQVERPADLLEAIAAEAEGCTIGLGVLERNTAAVEAVRALGLTWRADAPWRMALGPSDALGVSPMAYAIGSPAKG